MGQAPLQCRSTTACAIIEGLTSTAMKSFQGLVCILCASLLVSPLAAQSEIRIDSPQGRLGWLTRPYQARSVPPINLANTSRLESLLRAGNLYLSAQDVVALALENNIDIEVQRYGPLLARELLRRAEGGGLLRNVGQSVSPGPTSVSLSGVTVNTNGAPSTGGGAGVSAGGGIITQLGPNVPGLDPTVVGIASFQHSTSPQ